jgi:pyruvate/2-oxoglutarate dehydrogenase complex dihydrolipoamide acyltransferase (E2) component
MAKHPTYQIKPAYREGMGAVVRDMLEGIGVAPEHIRFHVDGTVTVKVSDAQLETMRAQLEGLVEYTSHSNSGEICISTPETDAYFDENSPVYTEAERATRAAGKSASTSKVEADKRRALREARRRKAADLHGIDLSDEGN